MRRSLAAALEVRAGYLFGEIPELEEIDPSEVAVRESMRAFLAKKPIQERENKRYSKTVDLPAAPRTVQGWKDLEELLHRLRGRKG